MLAKEVLWPRRMNGGWLRVKRNTDGSDGEHPQTLVQVHSLFGASAQKKSSP